MLGVDPTVEVLVANQVLELEVEVLAKVLQAVAAKVVVAKVAMAYLEIVSLVATPVPQEIHFSSYHSLAAAVVATVVMAVVYRFSK